MGNLLWSHVQGRIIGGGVDVRNEKMKKLGVARCCLHSCKLERSKITRMGPYSGKERWYTKLLGARKCKLSLRIYYWLSKYKTHYVWTSFKILCRCTQTVCITWETCTWRRGTTRQHWPPGPMPPLSSPPWLWRGPTCLSSLTRRDSISQPLMLLTRP